jgi:hypothetical protein
MKRFFSLFLLLAASCLVTPGCSFFTSPDEARFGDLQINIRFAGSANSGAAAKNGMIASPQALDRLVVIVFEYSFQNTRDNGDLERELLRREFRLGDNRQLQTIIQVPLENPEISCFRVVVRAFEGALLLYSGEDPNVCFDEENRRTQAEVLLDPEAFRLQLSNNLPPIISRVFALNGQVRDTALTQIKIVMADSVTVLFPVLGQSFSNPVMLFGSNSLIKVSAFLGNEFRGEASRRIMYTGRPADALVALVWNEPVNLDLEVQNPLQQVISALVPGDSVGGNGVLQITDNNGYGPEVFEWRQSTRIPNGPFNVRVVRPRVGLPVATGKVYMLFREGQAQQSIRSFPFEFKQQDTALFIDIPGFTWPVP